MESRFFWESDPLHHLYHQIPSNCPKYKCKCGHCRPIHSRHIQQLLKVLLEATDIPVFSGVGGGLTQGARSSYMSLFAGSQGSLGVVLNGPTPLETVQEVHQVVDIPRNQYGHIEIYRSR